jgi:hypothetical protein
MNDWFESPKKKKKNPKKKIVREENKVLMMRFESKRDSLPRERIDDGARDKGSFASSSSTSSSRPSEKDELAGAERKASEILYEYTYKNTYVRNQVLV